MNTGSKLWINSEEISISRLTKPNAQMAGGMRRRVANELGEVGIGAASKATVSRSP